MSQTQKENGCKGALSGFEPETSYILDTFSNVWEKSRSKNHTTRPQSLFLIRRGSI